MHRLIQTESAVAPNTTILAHTWRQASVDEAGESKHQDDFRTDTALELSFGVIRTIAGPFGTESDYYGLASVAGYDPLAVTTAGF
jgi:hypothetical protein